MMTLDVSNSTEWMFAENVVLDFTWKVMFASLMFATVQQDYLALKFMKWVLELEESRKLELIVSITTQNGVIFVLQVCIYSN